MNSTTVDPPDTPRSRKRRRSSSPCPSPSSSPSNSTRESKKKPLERLPPAELLLALPALVAVPPNHRLVVVSYGLSIAALRRCVALAGAGAGAGVGGVGGGMGMEEECRAWMGIAELGLRLVRAGWSRCEQQFPWARGLDLEVENAIGKGLLVSQQSPSLAVYRQNLTLIHARLAHWRQNEKYSRTWLKRLISSFSPPPSLMTNSKFQMAAATTTTTTTPSWMVYTVHLTGIAQALARAPPDLKTAFSTIQDLLSASEVYADSPVTLLTHILRLRTLVDAGMWDAVGDSLALAESALGMSYNNTTPMSTPTPTPTPVSSEKEKGKQKVKVKEDFVSFEDPFEAAMAVHSLLMGVVYYTHVGKAKASSMRLSHLHALLDSDALDLFPNGTIDIPLSSGPPLTIKCTHPRVLYQLAYLVSSVSKRDAVGRRPKRKVFASEGLSVLEKNIKKEIPLNPWAEPRDAEEVEERMVKVKADLLSELVAVCIMRSEFEEASEQLDNLIAHTRTYNIFTTYAARITLHHAHLAHALGDTTRAAQCYAVAAHLAADGTFVNVSARAGGLALRIARGEGDWRRRTDLEWEKEVGEVVDACRGMGGTLEAIGHVLRACLASEILSAKAHLKSALDLASDAQDNYLRVFILALVSALYLRTSEAHACAMLETCGQLAAGLGAIQKPDPAREDEKGKEVEYRSVGNATLGLWVGERFLEIYRREGDEEKVRMQEGVNERLRDAVEMLVVRRRAILGLGSASASAGAGEMKGTS